MSQINVLSKVKILTGNTSQPTDCVFWNFNVLISIQSWERNGKKKERKIDSASGNIAVPSQSSKTAHRAVVSFQSLLPSIANIEIFRFLRVNIYTRLKHSQIVCLTCRWYKPAIVCVMFHL